jgi:phosphatidylethanolamine/phosphatidyl-N-methylethanolamine N-methyltransferase
MRVDFFPVGRIRRFLDRLQRRLGIGGGDGLTAAGAVESAYARWAPVYDWVFTAPLVAGQRAAAREANLHSGDLLEVGVGTGLSLPLYSRDHRITGIDLSKPMLERARDRVRRRKLKNVVALRAMDASAMDFPEARFDIATVMYVMTVVPDPSAVLEELERVVKPGGTVIIVNHFASESGVLAAAERFLARFAEKLGWDPLFPREKVLANTSMVLERESRHGPFGLFTMMVFRR